MTVPEPTKTDEELVNASLAGSQQSFVLLMHRYEHLVFGLCRHMLGCREDALDATQDAFLVCFKRLGELRRQAEFRAWLRRIATNECRQRLRARRFAGELDSNLASADPFPRVDDALDLDRALSGLSSDTRLTVLLFYFEGNSVREIALFFGLPESTVMSRLRNARLQLRQGLQTMFDQPINRPSLPRDFVDQIPIPYDEYAPYRGPKPHHHLSPWREAWLLSAYPYGSKLVSVELKGHDWEAIPDRAVQAVVRTPDGSTEVAFLRMCARKDGIRTEAALLPLLSSLGLPAPTIVAGPIIDPDLADRGMLLATTPPAGRSALEWAVDGGTKAIDRACDIVMDGIDWIARLTPQIETSPVADLLERCSLADELARVVEVGGPWMSDSRFSEAIRLLSPVVAAIDVPLIFSDSGIGPNARVDDDGNLIGFDTFAWARIEDPHYQIAKYWTYDCWPIRRAGFVERYLMRNKLSLRDFAPRLGVRALVTLQREIPLRGGDDGYRNDMLGWLKMAVDNL